MRLSSDSRKWPVFTTESKTFLLPVLHIHSSFFFNFVVLSLKCMYAFLRLTNHHHHHHHHNPSVFIPVFSIFPHSSLSPQKCFSYSCDLRSDMSLSLAPVRWRQHVPPTRLNKLIILCGTINQKTAIRAAFSVKAWKLLKWGLDISYVRFTVCSIL